jgi:starvation-inducible DNA-binding protein
MSIANEHLKEILANTFVLYMKSFHVHWNMRDERFYFLHRMIEEQYKELAELIDQIAERIRQKNGIAPLSLAEMLAMTSLSEAKRVESADKMLKELQETYEQQVTKVHAMILIAGELNDFVTQDLMIEYARFIEKTVWIIGSHQS